MVSQRNNSHATPASNIPSYLLWTNRCRCSPRNSLGTRSTTGHMSKSLSMMKNRIPLLHKSTPRRWWWVPELRNATNVACGWPWDVGIEAKNDQKELQKNFENVVGQSPDVDKTYTDACAQTRTKGNRQRVRARQKHIQTDRKRQQEDYSRQEG